jgi:hypothetical protein
MKYNKIKKITDLFYKLAQQNVELVKDKLSDGKQLAEVKQSPEFDALAKAIQPHIKEVIADADYSRDKPKGSLIAIAMADSVIYTGFAHSDSDWLGAEPALLVRIAAFIDEIDFQRKPNVPAVKINLNTEKGCLTYTYELIMKAGGNGSKYKYEYYTGPRDRIVGYKYPNSNFNRWVVVTFK